MCIRDSTYSDKVSCQYQSYFFLIRTTFFFEQCVHSKVDAYSCQYEDTVANYHRYYIFSHYFLNRFPCVLRTILPHTQWLWVFVAVHRCPLRTPSSALTRKRLSHSYSCFFFHCCYMYVFSVNVVLTEAILKQNTKFNIYSFLVTDIFNHDYVRCTLQKHTIVQL